MALGRNLKRQQLIPDSEDAGKKGHGKASPKAKPKKATVAGKKTKKSSPKPVAKKDSAPREQLPVDVQPIEKKEVSATPQEKQEQPEVQPTEDQIAPKTAINTEEIAPTIETPPAKATTDTSAASTSPETVTNDQIAPLHQAQQATYVGRRDVTIVSQRDYEKRLQLKEKFDNEIRALKGKKLLLIVFKLGGQEFAIEIDKTKEVVKTPEISSVPHLPEHMVGVANVRGKVVLIMDLGQKFRITDGAAKWEDPYSIVIQNAGYKIGLLVPEVPNTVMVEGNNISTAAAIVTDTARDQTYIKGIVKQEGRMIFFLDIEELVEGNKVNVVPDEVPAVQ